MKQQTKSREEIAELRCHIYAPETLRTAYFFIHMEAVSGANCHRPLFVINTFISK